MEGNEKSVSLFLLLLSYSAMFICMFYISVKKGHKLRPAHIQVHLFICILSQVSLKASRENKQYRQKIFPATCNQPKPEQNETM